MPSVILHAVPVTIPLLPLIEHELSSVLNPEPVTVTVIPTPPAVGLSTIEAPLTTVKKAWAESPLLPFSVITYDPGATLLTTKLPRGVPLPILMVQAAFWTGVPLIEHELSSALNPAPVTVTVCPTPPELGLSVIDAPAVTVKEA